MAVQTISGDFVSVLGVAEAGRAVKFRPVVPVWNNGVEIIVGEEFTVTANGSGVATVAVEPGQYTGTVNLSYGAKAFLISVGGAGPYDWSDVVTATTPEAIEVLAQQAAASAAAAQADRVQTGLDRVQTGLDATTASTAALASGEPIVTTLTSPVPANGTIERLVADGALKVYQVVGGAWVFQRWLGKPSIANPYHASPAAVADGLTDDYAAIQHAIDNPSEITFEFGTIKLIEIGPGNFATRGGHRLPEYSYLALRDCTIRLLPYSFQPIFLNANAPSMKVAATFSPEPRDDGTGGADIVIPADPEVRAAVGAWVEPGMGTFNIATPTDYPIEYGVGLAAVDPDDIEAGETVRNFTISGTTVVSGNLISGRLYRMRARVHTISTPDTNVGFANSGALAGRNAGLAGRTTVGLLDFMFVAAASGPVSLFTNGATVNFHELEIFEVLAHGRVNIGGYHYQMVWPGNEWYGALPAAMYNGAQTIRLRPGMDRFISIVGSGNAVLDGGERFNRPGGNAPRWRERAINLSFCADFHISDMTIQNTASWAVTMEHVRRGTVRNITFRQGGWQGRTSEEGDAGWRTEAGLPNQDGIDLRKGCQDIVIDGVHGGAGDDLIAISNLYVCDDSVAERNNHFSSNFAPYGPGTLRVSIFNVTGKAKGSHHTIRLLSSDNNPVQAILIDGVHDMTAEVDVFGNEYGRVESECCILIGDGRYGDNLSTGDAISNIVIKNVTTTSRYAILFKGPARRVHASNVSLHYNPLVGGESVDRLRYLIGFQAGILHGSQRMTGATKANPCAVTLSQAHGLQTGDQVYISEVQGMEALNDGTYTITETDSANTYTLDGVDSTGIEFGVFVASTKDKYNWARSVDYLVFPDCVFENFSNINTKASGSNAGIAIDVRDGARITRGLFRNFYLYGSSNVIWMRDHGCEMPATDLDGFFTYLIRGPFLRADKGVGNSSGRLTNFRSVGRRYNLDQLDGGPEGRFYNSDFWFGLDHTCPDVDRSIVDDVEIDAIPPATVPSEVYFASVGNSQRRLMETRGNAWVPIARDSGQPVHCAVTAQTTTAITLNSGMSLTEIPVGFQVSFIPGATNEGSTTLQVDTPAAVACRTVRGGSSTLPDGYIREDFLTRAYWNGTHWIVDRESEIRSGNDGHPWRAQLFADGRLIVAGSLVMTSPCSLAAGNIFRSTTTVTHTFPIASVAHTRATIEMGDANVHRDVRQTNLGAVIVRSWSATTDSSTSDVVPYQMHGFWY